MKRRAQASFAWAADRYVESSILAEGAELERMLELARLRGDERVLDIATGGGHTALALAPQVREVVASDLTPAMLAAAARHLAERGASNVRFEIADAESLPFADTSCRKRRPWRSAAESAIARPSRPACWSRPGCPASSN